MVNNELKGQHSDFSAGVYAQLILVIINAIILVTVQTAAFNSLIKQHDN